MFGKPLSAYLAFQRAVLILIVLVWGARLALSLAGVPDAVGKFVSITVVLLATVLYYPWAVHSSGFGSYRQLYPLFLIQGIFSQTLVAGAIALAILTGHDNIFTVPEFYPPSAGGTPLPVDGKNWGHAGTHIVVAGAIVLPLVSWLLGSIVLAALRKFSAPPAGARSS
jgi:hypothetical protein